MGLKNEARIPPSERCPCKPIKPSSAPSAINFWVSSAVGNLKTILIKERLSGLACGAVDKNPHFYQVIHK